MVRLKEIREAAGLTQEKVAADLNVKIGTYRSWEQGHRGLNGKRLSMLADYFSTTADDILGFSPAASGVASLKERQDLTQKAHEYACEEKIEAAELSELLDIFVDKLNAEERRLLITVARSLAEGKQE